MNSRMVCDKITGESDWRQRVFRIKGINVHLLIYSMQSHYFRVGLIGI